MRRAHPIPLLLALAVALPSRAAAPLPAPATAPPAQATAPLAPGEPIPELFAAVAAATELPDAAARAQRLAELAAPTRRLVVKPTTAYDPVQRRFRVRLPEEVLAVDQPGAPEGQRSVISYRLAPASRELLEVLETPCPPSEAPYLVDDLRLVVEVKVAQAGAVAPGKGAWSPLARAVARHQRKPKEAWEGEVVALTLAVDLRRIALVRASTGAELARRAIGEAGAKGGEAEAGKLKGPAPSRKSVDRYGRAGSQWTMRDQDAYMRACRGWMKGQAEPLDVQRRCRCMMELMQLRHPKQAPKEIEAKEGEALRLQCDPRGGGKGTGQPASP